MTFSLIWSKINKYVIIPEGFPPEKAGTSMNITITPAPLIGSIPAVPSKSQAHRLLIAAALADRPTRIQCRGTSQDIAATIQCLSALGCEIKVTEDALLVMPIVSSPMEAQLDCGESAATLRFLLALVGAMGVSASFRLHGRLPERPLSPLWEELERHGCRLMRPTPDSIRIEGKLSAGDYRLPGNVSSQFFSGLLLALPLLEGTSTITALGALESSGYVAMTKETQSQFGIISDCRSGVFTVLGGQKYHPPGCVSVEGDWSAAAIWQCAAALGGEPIAVTGLCEHSRQGDEAIRTLLPQVLRGDCMVDCRAIPDLAPILAAAAALGEGTVRFIQGERLRYKESDRIRAIVGMLRSLGAEAKETKDGFVVTGKPRLAGGTVDCRGDHRIAMSAAAASVGCTGRVSILHADAVAKSYPRFWQDFAALGGQYRVEKDENIYLIGMPGCGKTTVGRSLAAALDRPFIDIDEQIVLTFGCSIPEIFRAEGETGFRRRETEVLRAIEPHGGTVIATGGGCVTRPENEPLICGRGKVIWLQRALELLSVAGRPLSLSRSPAALFAERRALYQHFSQTTADNNGTVAETVESIISSL